MGECSLRYGPVAGGGTCPLEGGGRAQPCGWRWRHGGGGLYRARGCHGGGGLHRTRGCHGAGGLRRASCLRLAPRRRLGFLSLCLRLCLHLRHRLQLRLGLSLLLLRRVLQLISPRNQPLL